MPSLQFHQQHQQHRHSHCPEVDHVNDPNENRIWHIVLSCLAAEPPLS